MMRRLLVSTGLVVSLGIFGAGCASAPVVAAEKAAASVLISDKQEAELGQQLHQELAKQGIQYVQDQEVLNYVQGLATPILQAANAKRPGVKWHVHVVQAPEINAFATPGGHLYIHTGLIKAAKNEAELAGVIAHEAGHVVGRHSARNMVQAFGLQTIASIALGENPSMLKQVAASVVAQGAMLRHSRQQETEADELGAQLTRRAGWDPHGLIGFFQTLQKQSGDTPGALAWFSTHPPTGDRISHLQQYISSNNLRGGQQSRPQTQLSAIQQKLPATGTGGGGGTTR